MIKKRKSTTVRTYISAIKFVLTTDGYDWNAEQVLLNTITRSCKIKNDRLKVRLPIQKGLLELILFRLQRKFDTQPYLEALYISAFLLQYYGLLRIGEIAESVHSIKAINVHEAKNQKRILLVLYTSKTHGRDKPPQKIKIFSNRTVEITNSNNLIGKYTMKKLELGKFCPVEWTKRYIDLRDPIQCDEENLFTFRDKKPIKPQIFRNLLRETIKGFNLDESLYDTHSFRIGRATDLFRAGSKLKT